MSTYEREQQRLRHLLASVETESELGDSDSETDNISQSDRGTGSEQEIDASDDFHPQLLTAEHFYSGKDGTVWLKENPPRNVETRSHNNIVTHLPGVKKLYRNLKTPLECLMKLFDDRIMHILVESTNIYISTLKSKFSRERDALDTNEAELKAMFGLLFYAGVLRAAHLNAKDLWSTDGCGMGIFQTTMSINRFHFLLRCLRFDDINSRDERKTTDKLAPIREVLEIFTKNIQEIYSVSEYCTIDKKLEPFRGKCRFKQYIKSKPAKYGIKIFALCDSQTFYTYNLEIYAGQQSVGPYRCSNKAVDVVKRLILPISGTGRNITMDNWFMSIPLAYDLVKDHKLTCVGTLRRDESEIPLEFLPHKTREIHSSLFGFNDKGMTLVSYVPKKNKSVLVLSSLHDDDKIDPSSGEQLKPEMISFYNLTKSVVDTVDELCRTYSVSRRCRRWPLTVFFGLMNIAGINAFIIHRSNNQHGNLNRRAFLKELGLELVKDHLRIRSNVPSLSKEFRIGVKRLAGELTHGNLQPENYPKRFSGRCDVCPRRDDRKTSVSCSECNKLICKRHVVVFCEQCSNKQME